MQHTPVKIFLYLLVGIWAVTCAPNPQQPGEQKLKIQPELDKVDVAKYLKNERLVRLQVKCLIFDGPCDIVGKWAKSRIKGILLGRCDYCTEIQKGWIVDWYDILVEKFPTMYRAAVAKYIQNEGIEIGEEEKKKIEDAFREDAVGSYLQNIKVVEATVLSKSNSADASNGPNSIEKLSTISGIPSTSSSITTTYYVTQNEMETTTVYGEMVTETETYATIDTYVE